MRIPTSTYRLQIRESFDLNAAATIAGYVHDLGADWLYLSPILKAEKGSDHGYDVVDHSLIDPARGGREGLETLSAAARALGLGVLVDIVPNHVGVATPKQSIWWWDLLTHGRQSRYAEAFDVDWQFGDGRVRIPVLGDEPHPEFEIVEGELAYFDNRFPIAPGTADDGASANEVHRRQNYELINWRRADAELNYRRFFAVNTLAGIRVEIPRVFDESHEEIIRWITDGLADGLRVDHPDGLADPAGYLDALAAATAGTYVLVEKILEGDEQLPTSWATAGTTGYDALAEIDRVLVDPAGRAALDALDSTLRDSTDPVSWTLLIHGTKRAIADGILRSEVLRLERDLGIGLGIGLGALVGALQGFIIAYVGVPSFIVTLGGEDLVDPDLVIDTMHYEHPLYTPESIAAQRQLPLIATGRIAFAGAYHGWGFHEDGALSGLRAAEHLGVTWEPRASRAPALEPVS